MLVELCTIVFEGTWFVKIQKNNCFQIKNIKLWQLEDKHNNGDFHL